MRVNQETKWKFIVVYREVIEYIVKYSLRRAGGQGLRAPNRTPGPSVRLYIYHRSCNLARAGLQFTCIFIIDPATWPPSGALGAPWAPRCARDLDLKVILEVFLCRRGCKVPTLQTIMCQSGSFGNENLARREIFDNPFHFISFHAIPLYYNWMHFNPLHSSPLHSTAKKNKSKR